MVKITLPMFCIRLMTKFQCLMLVLHFWIKRSFNYANLLTQKGNLFGRLLVSNGTFRAGDADRVKDKHTYDDMAEEIINILKRKSDCCFKTFIDALNATDQNHVVYMLTSGGDPPVCSRDIERVNRKLGFITQRIEPTRTGLLDRLVELGAFTRSDHQRVRSENDCIDQSRLLIELITRKSQKSFDKLKEALETTGQKHIAVEIFGSLVNGMVEMKTYNNLSAEEFAALENKVRDEMIKNNSTDTQELQQQGVNTAIIEGSIKICFTCLSLDALEFLKKVHSSNRLGILLTEKYRPMFAAIGLESLTVVIPEYEFKRCGQEFVTEASMSETHLQVLQRVAETMADQILVSDVLLKKLSLGDVRINAVIAEKTNVSRSKLLLSFVSHLPDIMFTQFIAALRETGHNDVANALAQVIESIDNESEGLALGNSELAEKDKKCKYCAECFPA